VAIHELGHAVMSELVKAKSVASVTIVPRGQALGFVRQAPLEDKYLYTKEELLGQIRVALAGAFSEELIFGSMSTGSQNDFYQASRLAKKMVLSGLSHLGVVSEEIGQNELNYEIMRIINNEGIMVRERLQRFKRFIKETATIIRQEERLEGDVFRKILGEYVELLEKEDEVAAESELLILAC